MAHLYPFIDEKHDDLESGTLWRPHFTVFFVFLSFIYVCPMFFTIILIIVPEQSFTHTVENKVHPLILDYLNFWKVWTNLLNTCFYVEYVDNTLK